mmetsp:Transcript_10941/g.5550  ORF Transcript_10941/g.5550 Transcript_10941/m.5550 type:complete len:84 (-) Transcript_10941:47-298(-)
MDTQKPVAAVCHGVQLLTAARLLEGRNVTGYFACAPECELAGAHYKSVGVDEAVVDRNLVTAVAWPGHPAWLREFLKVLGTQI